MMNCYTQISKNPEIYQINFPQQTGRIYFDAIFSAGKFFELQYNLKGAGHVFEHYVIGNFFEKYNLKPINLNGFNSDISTGFYFESEEKEFIENLENLLQEIFKTDFSNKNAFEREFLSIKNELLERKNILDNQFYEEEIKKLFSEKCPISQKIISRNDLENINIEKIKLFHKKFLSAKPIFFIGGYKLKNRFIEKFKEKIKNYSKKDNISIKIKKCEFLPADLLEIKNPSIREGIYSSFNFPGLYEEKNNVDERLALNMLKKVIADDPKFGIFLKLREKGIFSLDIDNIMNPAIGIFSLQSFCAESQLMELLAVDIDYFKTIKKQLIGKKIIERLTEDIIINQKEAWNSNDQLYKWIMNDIERLGFVADKKFYSKILLKITPEYLNKLINKIFDFNKMNLTLIHSGKENLKILEIYKILERRWQNKINLF